MNKFIKSLPKTVEEAKEYACSYTAMMKSAQEIEKEKKSLKLC